MKNNMYDENGTIYFGDGNWGADFFGCEVKIIKLINKVNENSNIEKTGIYNSVWITKYDG